jgi:hypothetical protein
MYEDILPISPPLTTTIDIQISYFVVIKSSGSYFCPLLNYFPFLDMKRKRAMAATITLYFGCT